MCSSKIKLWEKFSGICQVNPIIVGGPIPRGNEGGIIG